MKNSKNYEEIENSESKVLDLEGNLFLLDL